MKRVVGALQSEWKGYGLAALAGVLTCLLQFASSDLIILLFIILLLLLAIALTASRRYPPPRRKARLHYRQYFRIHFPGAGAVRLMMFIMILVASPSIAVELEKRHSIQILSRNPLRSLLESAHELDRRVNPLRYPPFDWQRM